MDCISCLDRSYSMTWSDLDERNRSLLTLLIFFSFFTIFSYEYSWTANRRNDSKNYLVWLTFIVSDSKLKSDRNGICWSIFFLLFLQISWFEWPLSKVVRQEMGAEREEQDMHQRTMDWDSNQGRLHEDWSHCKWGPRRSVFFFS